MSFSEEPNRSGIDSLYRISSLVNKTEDPHEALDLILEEIVTSLGASSASIALINPDTNRLEIEAYRGLPQATQSISLTLGEGITGWVALHGKPLLVKDVTQENRYVNIKDSIRSEMAVPMKNETIDLELSEKATIGVVNVDSEELAAFGPTDLKLLTLLTNEATKVVTRLWNISQLKEKADQLESLINIGQQLVKKLELQEVLHTITKQAQELMNCSVCAIYLYNRTEQTIALESLAGIEGMDYHEELNLDQSAIGVAIQRNKQITVLDIAKTEEHHFINITQQKGLSSMLSTPITFENEVIGILNAYTDKTHRFNNEEKKVFSLLATLGAVAIQNTRLYSRVFASENSLRKNERLTTLGLLAAEIAHEIRNPLTVIKLLFESLDLDFNPSDARHQDCQVIGEKIVQLEEIVGNVLTFGKSNVELYSRRQVSPLIEETLVLVRLKLQQSKVHLHFTPLKEPAFVEVHKGQIQQVLLNLIINAEQAMAQGGHITLTLSTSTIGTQKHVIIQVSDTGTGIPEKIQDKIFDSFLTSRRDGTGLGLSISKQIMKQHRGDIELLKSSEAGTTFELKLPCVNP